MDSSMMDAEQGNASTSNKKLKGITKPSILLVVLFWHHIIFAVLCAWSAIGIIALPNSRDTLTGIVVMVTIQAICAISGIAGAHQKNMKFIYYFGCSQCVLAAMELFWAFACVFNRMILMFCVLLMFCLYQIFLSYLAFRYKNVECEWRILGYIWPFSIGVHPNHLPSVADKINEQPSELPFAFYNSFSETRSQYNNNNKPHISAHPRASEISSRSSSVAAPISSVTSVTAAGEGTVATSLSKKLADARELEHSHTTKSVLITEKVPQKSMHPTTSDLSATSSVSGGTVSAKPQLAEAVVKTSDVKDKMTQRLEVCEPRTAIEKPSFAAAAIELEAKKSSPALTNAAQGKADESPSSKAPTNMLEKIFGNATSLSTPDRLKQQNSPRNNNNGKKAAANGGTVDEYANSKKHRRTVVSPRRTADDRQYYHPELQLPLSPSASVEETKAAQRNSGKSIANTKK